LGASYGTAYGKSETTPAPLRDPTSFNRFRSDLFTTATTGDTLVLPDDIRSSDIQQRAWEAAGGASWHLPGRKGLVGAEYHYLRQLLDQIIGQGAVEEETLHQPGTLSESRTISWEARSGIEYRCSDVLTGRAGYVYRYEDLDTETKLNESVSNSVTAGVGLRPAGAMWTVETGYAFEWGQADYASPSRPRFTRQQLAFQFRWDF
jgi:hypothetical protein